MNYGHLSISKRGQIVKHTLYLWKICWSWTISVHFVTYKYSIHYICPFCAQRIKMMYCISIELPKTRRNRQSNLSLRIIADVCGCWANPYYQYKYRILQLYYRHAFINLHYCRSWYRFWFILSVCMFRLFSIVGRHNNKWTPNKAATVNDQCKNKQALCD